MFKRRTSRVRKRPQVKVLRAHVMTPRIFWHDFRRTLGSFFRLVFWLALGGVACWGVWLGVKRGLLENDEFRLRELTLNDNPAVNQDRLLEVTGIDLEGSLFDCDPGEVEERLRALPEVAGAKVTRDFPGRISIEVAAREPRVWVACVSNGVAPRDLGGGLLVDGNGRLFHCTSGMVDRAMGLPVIEVAAEPGELEAGGKIASDTYFRGMRLLGEAIKIDPGAAAWIDTIRQHKGWGSEVVTREGTVAVFGHSDIGRQMKDFLLAMDHAEKSGRKIATIHLVGRRNLPVTFQGEAPPPRAIPVEEPAPRPENSDLQELLDR